MRSRRQIAPEDDLAFVNPDPKAVMRRWAPLPRDDWEKIEERVRRSVRMKDDFVQIPFPRLAAASSRQIVAAVEQYKHEAAIVDPRLSREVTLSFKSAALSDVCDELHAQTGIQLTAGPSVADEKVTIFCEKMPLRQVMRAINHLLGDTWLRSREALGVRRQALGEKTDDPNAQHPTPNAEYRYELEQDLRSQLLEEELRNRDRNAALLALDAEMQQYRPYLSMSPDELKKQWDQQLKGGKRSFWERPDDSREVRLWYLVAEEAWGGVQLYYRLSPRGRAALMAGQELVFKPDAPDPDRRLPDELCGAILRSLNVPAWDNGHPTRVAELPGVRLEQVRLRLDRSELGKLSLIATMAAVWGRADNGLPRVYPTRELATGLSPSEAKLDNASANAALRGHSPFDQRVSLRPEPSCPVMKRTDPGELDQVLLSDASHDLDPSQPYASSADVWEAVHRATGLPIVADYYTHLYPLSLVSVQRQPLFEALCSVGDALRARWRKEGDFLLCRSTSYFWDKLKEVPNRYLQRWAHDREASGALPLVDFLEMAGMADQQLGSQPVGQGIEHYWGLREWAHLRDYRLRHDARCVALLMPEQLRRAQEPAGLPVRELTPAQQQGILRLQFEKQEATEREGGWSRPIRPEEFANTRISATYVPAGWYLAFVVPQYVGHVQSWTGPWDYAGGRTAAEAAAAARRLYPGASPVEVHYARDGFFRADISTP